MLAASSKSFPERRLDAEPHCPDKPRHDHGDDCLECITLRLLDASAPTPQMLKIGAKLGECLGHLSLPAVWQDVLARHRIGIVHREIRHGRAESNRRKIRLLVVMPGAWDELNDFSTRENSSVTTMATSPTSASDIR
jgi:hypothetical protein